MFLKIFFVICIQVNFVYNCDDSVSDVTDTSTVSEEYLNIFRTIPTLFEYVMDVIEEKPEILEKDDISVFTMESNRFFDEVPNDESSSLVTKSGSKEIVDIGKNDSADGFVDVVSEEGIDDFGSIEESYEGFSESTEYLDNSDEDDEEEEDDDDDDDEDEYDWDSTFTDYWAWFASAATKNTFSLTSTEIADKTLEIEKQLEEYNNNNKS
ncbi:uncharacterized protein [Epargyreus clarus]|uniref:uncharacterized protein n=1 Tax=Epargyreus clarus TaxID=520877 RepID=UPI003C2ACB7E